MSFLHDGHDPEFLQDDRRAAEHGGRPRSTSPGKSSMTARLGASSTSIARAVVAQMRAADAAQPRAVQARGDLAGADVRAIAAEGTMGHGAPLPFLDEIQRGFGHHDVSGVRAHVGGAAAEASESIGAVAYAAGDDVAFARSPDLHLAAHEAAHVVQQRGGVRLSDGVGQSGDEYERHADAVADAVVRGESAEALLDGLSHRGSAGGSAVQRQLDREEQAEGGNQTGPGADPADRIVQEPDPGPTLDDFRALIQAIATDQNVPFPSDAWTAFVDQAEAIAGSDRPSGTIRDCTELGEAPVLAYNWRLHGSIRMGAPRDGSVRAHRGEGANRTGSESVVGTASEREQNETESRSLGAEGGGARVGTDRARGRRNQSSANRGTTRSAGSEMQIPLESIQWLSDVTANFNVSLTHAQSEPVPGTGVDATNDLFGCAAEMLGTDAVAPRHASVTRVIGQVNRGQQHAASAAPPRD